MSRVLVTGAGGAIGGHLVHRLLADGHAVRGVDVKPLDEWWQAHPAAANVASCDLSNAQAAHMMAGEVDLIFDLAAFMGGMGTIHDQQLETGLNVVLSVNMLLAADNRHVERFVHASSACVYADYRQQDPHNVGLCETDAWPAAPQDMYGLEKLFTEELALRFHRQRGLEVRLPRLHNCYGPHGAWTGGREKAPAAICRKVAEAKLLGLDEVEVWGDGEQTRSFMYVDDCVEGLLRIASADVVEPINLGTSEVVTINRMVDIVEQIADVKLKRRHNLDAPQGVRGRNSDNSRIRAVLGWEPSIPLATGLEATYRWVYDQLTGQM